MGTSGLVDERDQIAFLNHVLGLHMEFPDNPRDLGHHGYLHLHGLEDDDLVALGDHLAFIDDNLPNIRGDLSPDLVHAWETSVEHV